MYFEKVKDIYQQIHEEERLAETYMLISWVHSHQGNYIESSEANLAALSTFESINDDYGAAIASGNLAGDYLKLDKNKEAIYYLTKGLSTLEKNGDYVNLSGIFLKLANTFMNLKNYNEAVKQIQTAFE